jgi:hypothetical protein
LRTVREQVIDFDPTAAGRSSLPGAADDVDAGVQAVREAVADRNREDGSSEE